MASRIRTFFRQLFRSNVSQAGSASQPAAAVSPAPRPAAPAPPTLQPGIEIGPLPSLEGAPLLSQEDVHKMFLSVSQNYDLDPKLQTLVDDSFDYDALFRNNQMPSKDDPEFVAKLSHFNSNIMAANDHLLESFAESAAEYFQKYSQEREHGDPELAKRYEKVGICLKKLAENMQGQKIKLINLYDQALDSYRRNPEALANLENPTFKAIYAGQKPYQKKELEGKALGSGAMNTVYSVHVQGKDQVFKEGHVHLRDMDTNEAFFFRSNIGVTPTDFTYGDKVQTVMTDVNTAKRDVAMSRVDKLFGLGIVVNTSLARSERGELSSLMEFAGGRSVQSCDYAFNAEASKGLKLFQQDKYPALIAAQKDACQSLLNRMEMDPEQKELFEMSLKENESTIKLMEEKLANPVINIREQSLNQGLMEMAALDYICSHTDRHVGNYKIEEINGQLKVHAIDNDTAFKNKETETLGSRLKPVVKLESNFPFVTAELKQKIDSVTPQTLRDSLNGLLSKEQVDIACSRLENIQKHFQKIPVVEGNFTESQLDQLLSLNQSQHSYNAHLAFHANMVLKDPSFTSWISKHPEYETAITQRPNAPAKPAAGKPIQEMDFRTFAAEVAEKYTPKKAAFPTSTSKKAPLEKEVPEKEHVVQPKPKVKS